MKSIYYVNVNLISIPDIVKYMLHTLYKDLSTEIKTAMTATEMFFFFNIVSIINQTTFHC